MAFKLDFAKLATPKTDAELEAEHKEWESKRNAVIATRATKVHALSEVVGLTEWEQKFFHSLHYAATTYGMCDILGEKLF